MVNRRAISLSADPRVRQVVLDTAAAEFPLEVTKLAQILIVPGDPVFAACCVGVGQGSLKWSEEELRALEIGVVGGWRHQSVCFALGRRKHLAKQDPLCADLLWRQFCLSRP
ncbi:hypothetical protein [Bradyrhizobium uaiense]|uniref:Uncharacterized protein n=1 Tax=Bradyrhizobium uaiense TaxID=2594946 RepID=A0A6P1BP41_9BRAD|nr:hypothetical protein [Bradyrhizobium uaiense]NEU99331.1 hypothetical protein [Bradyrhizobium uaiense]